MPLPFGIRATLGGRDGMYALDRMRALHAVWRRGSLATAAETLHVTPSAVSQQIAKLEREVGGKLIVKSGRGVNLSPAGLTIARRTDEILRTFRHLERDLDRLVGHVSGTLHVATVPTAVSMFVTSALARLATEYPDLRVMLSEGEPEATLVRLAHGEVDVAVVAGWENMPLHRPDEISWVPLCDDHASVVLPAAHPLAGDTDVRLCDLDGMGWVSWPAGSRAQTWLLETLRAHGVAPFVRCTVGGPSTQVAVVAELGVAALLPAMAAPAPGPAGAGDTGVRAVPVAPRLRRRLYAAWRDDAHRGAIDAVVAGLRDAAGPCGRDPGGPGPGPPPA